MKYLLPVLFITLSVAAGDISKEAARDLAYRKPTANQRA